MVVETHTANSRECALVVVEDEAGVIAIASFLESAATQILKTSSSTLTQRALLSGASTIANIARVPTCCTVLSSRALPKGSGKDLFGCLLQVVETLKGAVRGTTPYEVLLATLRVLLTFCEHDGVLRRLKGRRRWVERLVGVVGAVEGAGRRRGAAEDGVRSELLERLLRVFA